MSVSQRGDYGGIFSVDVSLDLGAQATITTTKNTVTIPGLLATDDILAVIPPSGLDLGVAFSHAYVTGANEAVIVMSNPTAGNINPGALTYRIVIGRH